jgi:hypothetical protein
VILDLRAGDEHASRERAPGRGDEKGRKRQSGSGVKQRLHFKLPCSGLPQNETKLHAEMAFKGALLRQNAPNS